MSVRVQKYTDASGKYLQTTGYRTQFMLDGDLILQDESGDLKVLANDNWVLDSAGEGGGFVHDGGTYVGLYFEKRVIEQESIAFGAHYDSGWKAADGEAFLFQRNSDSLKLYSSASGMTAGTTTPVWTMRFNYDISAGDWTFNASNDFLFQDDGTTWVLLDGSARSVDITGDLDVSGNATFNDVAIDGSGQSFSMTGQQSSGSWKAKMSHTIARPTTLLLGMYIQDATASASDKWIGFYDNGGTYNGGIIGVGGTGVDYASSSDRRLKSGIVDADMPGALATVCAIRERDWALDDPSDPKCRRGRGWVAQELNEIYPEAVIPAMTVQRELEDGTIEEEEFPWQIVPSRLLPLLTRAMTEQNAEVEVLRGRLALAEAGLASATTQLAALEARLTALESTS